MAASDTDVFPQTGSPDQWLSWTGRMQALASDPRGTAWVSANAGSGKTHVLTQRVIRLLLSGSRPSSILCLTYTKAAASEMSNRVFDRLARWTTLPDDKLADEIFAMEGIRPGALVLLEARRLFARALETPGGLKIQTIHAFSEALLHQFPLEANVAGHFNVLDDGGAAGLLAEARRSLLTATAAEGDPALAEAFGTALDLADDTGVDALISEIISRRRMIIRFLDHARRNKGIAPCLRQTFGLDEDDSVEKMLADSWPLAGFTIDGLKHYIAAAHQDGGKTVVELATRLALAIETRDPDVRLSILKDALFTATGTPRKEQGLTSSAMRKQDPGLMTQFETAQAHLSQLFDRRARLGMAEATLAALTLAERLLADYEDLKRARSLLDFDDLIERTAELLRKPGIGPWVHYKLDQGIDHILVDEAQDTSPTQWEIIKSLASEFFSGDSARRQIRTFFVVGDEKQSIYSFQGARPERFDLERQETRRKAEGAGARFEAVRLPLSFRSTADVLGAVDQVFADPGNASGLSASGEAIVHVSSRPRDPGRVDIWNIIAPDDSKDESDDWTAPYDEVPEKAPANQLATRISAQIADMVGKATIITRQGPRRVEPGDIIVLVRKRDAFVGALTRALKKTTDIPVAGADRLVLASHIAIQDLMALGRFMLLPEDDLSLAAIFKSPLIALSEEQLFELAARRPEGRSLWHHLQDCAERLPAIADIVTRLGKWMDLSTELRVHDFYTRILSEGGGRKAYLARLGHEVSDVLDEFLTFAMAHETSALPGLQSFISTLETDAPTIKREQDKARGEVRIMTVHAAKGLEAPIVFLVDSGSAPVSHTHLPKFRMIETTTGTAPAWTVKSDKANLLKRDDDVRLTELAEQEYRRLLYVGMTRAADHLILCGYRGKKTVENTWHGMALAALARDEAHVTEATYEIGGQSWDGFCWRMTEGEVPSEPKQADQFQGGRTVKLPEKLVAPLLAEIDLPRPLVPSGTHTIIDESDGDLIVRSPLFSEEAIRSGKTGAQRGKIIHRLLELLADQPDDQREAIARRYLERAMADASQAKRDELCRQVLTVLADETVAHLMQVHGRSEVSIMGTIRLAERDHAITGRLDRLSVTDDLVYIGDFKTNRQPPERFDDIPAVHIAQLALYREVLKPLYPGKEFRLVLIYTEGPIIHHIGTRQVDAALVDISAKWTTPPSGH